MRICDLAGTGRRRRRDLGKHELAVGNEGEGAHRPICIGLRGHQRWMPIAAESPPSTGSTAPVR